MILKMIHINFEYEKKKSILSDFNFNIEDGKVGLIGSNGIGKSTILKLIVGLIEPQKGDIEICGEAVCKKNLANIRKNAGFVFQDADNQLFMPTVREDIAFGPANYGIKGEELDNIVDRVLNELGINELSDRKTTRLSGGEKKLVSIATVLALNPKLLIFDEPSIALDPGNRRKLINVLKNIDTAQIIATHDLDLVLDVCDRVVLLGNDGIMADGRPEDILYNRELLETCGLELPLCLQGRR